MENKAEVAFLGCALIIFGFSLGFFGGFLIDLVQNIVFSGKITLYFPF
jgi:hypothetical protein